MKTYWFTIASGVDYKGYADDLLKSAKRAQVAVTNVGGNSASGSVYRYEEQNDIKRLKIRGILEAPDGYDRIAYIDADTLIRDVGGSDAVNGALKEPWGMGSVPLVVNNGGAIRRFIRKRRLWRVLRRNGLEMFCPGGEFHRQEWNSGVIIGNRKFMEELAVEWEKWWSIVLDVNDGIFRRDQMSFKYAYQKIAIEKYGYDSIDPSYNWILKRLGYSRDANIYHRAGISNRPDLVSLWERVRTEVLS